MKHRINNAVDRILENGSYPTTEEITSKYFITAEKNGDEGIVFTFTDGKEYKDAVRLTDETDVWEIDDMVQSFCAHLFDYQCNVKHMTGEEILEDLDSGDEQE